MLERLKQELLKLECIYRENLEKLGHFELKDIRGSLVIAKRKYSVSYYSSVKDETTGKYYRKYLNNSQKDLAKYLAQKSYNDSVKKFLEDRLILLSKFNSSFAELDIDALYDNLSSERKELITPIAKTWEQQVIDWKQTPFEGLQKNNEYSQFLTNNNECVRSKSEKILADLFSRLGIIYKYECPLKLGNGLVLYPDFTFLSPHTHEEIYWEHHGMMDNPNYLKNTLKKIQTYEANGIFRGENLIITYESSNHVLNLEWVMQLVEKYLIKGD